MTDYPTWICSPCGFKYGQRTDYNGFTATFHSGTCDVCGRLADVTEPRDYGHLRAEWVKEKNHE